MCIHQRCGQIAWCSKEDCVRQGCEVHFQVLEGVICRIGHRVGLQYNLSSIDRWKNREVKQDIGGHVEDVCNASATEVGRVSSFGRVRIQ